MTRLTVTLQTILRLNLIILSSSHQSAIKNQLNKIRHHNIISISYIIFKASYSEQYELSSEEWYESRDWRISGNACCFQIQSIEQSHICCICFFFRPLTLARENSAIYQLHNTLSPIMTSSCVIRSDTESSSNLFVNRLLLLLVRCDNLIKLPYYYHYLNQVNMNKSIVLQTFYDYTSIVLNSVLFTQNTRRQNTCEIITTIMKCKVI
ncbi:Hypothetical_protein [Hexamita inflata]|uniref:Hypothetical_protein n=1 Tax=Hexamita inflata TaxID=28002 RepID=A0AA86NAV2_9EUKA|nr:Hypothetical protein HINF_LOCUS3244 [Hexamita inflata]